MRITPSRFADFSISKETSELIASVRNESPPAAQPTILEQRHPQLMQSIVLLWGHPEMNEFFERIWTGEKHRGLDPSIMAELMLLAQLHQRICPKRPTAPASLVLGGLRRSDPWQSARLRS